MLFCNHQPVRNPVDTKPNSSQILACQKLKTVPIQLVENSSHSSEDILCMGTALGRRFEINSPETGQLSYGSE